MRGPIRAQMNEFWFVNSFPVFLQNHKFYDGKRFFCGAWWRWLLWFPLIPRHSFSIQIVISHSSPDFDWGSMASFFSSLHTELLIFHTFLFFLNFFPAQPPSPRSFVRSSNWRLLGAQRNIEKESFNLSLQLPSLVFCWVSDSKLEFCLSGGRWWGEDEDDGMRLR